MEIPAADKVIKDIYRVHLPEHQVLRHLITIEEALESFRNEFDNILTITYDLIRRNPEYLGPFGEYSGKCEHNPGILHLQEEIIKNTFKITTQEDRNSFINKYAWAIRAEYCRLCCHNEPCGFNPEELLYWRRLETAKKSGVIIPSLGMKEH